MDINSEINSGTMECKICADISTIVFLGDRVGCQICVMKQTYATKVLQTQQVARNVAHGKLMNIAKKAKIKCLLRNARLASTKS